MAVPTAGEQAIYKSPVLEFEGTAQIEIGATVFDGSWEDQFDDTTVDPDKWIQFEPDGWGSITEASGYVEILGGTIPVGGGDPDEGVPYPPYMLSRKKTGSEFPTENNDFTLEVRIAFPDVEVYGVQFRVMGPEIVIFEVEANTDYGLNLKMGREPGDANYPADYTHSDPADTGWHTYRLEYTASTNTYEAFIDGGSVLSQVIDALPTHMVVGNSAVDQGFPGFWTTIRIDYVTITGTGETFTTPSWAATFSEDGVTWAYVDCVEFNINVDKENDADTCDLTIQNVSGDTPGIYTDYVFRGKRIRIKTRVGDGDSWNSWRTRFDGIIDRAGPSAEEADSTIRLECRDRQRRELFKSDVVISYGDYDTDIEGVVNGLTAAQIIDDLAQTRALLDPALYSISSANEGTLIPKTFNLVDTTVGDGISRLMEDLVWCWYVNPSDGILNIEPWYWADGGSVEYTITRSEEIDRIERSEDSFSAVAQVMVILQSAVGGYDIALGWPPSPIPDVGTIVRHSNRAGQSWDDLNDNALPYNRWRRENRQVGEITVEMTAQNWIEHNQRVGIDDDQYLNEDPTNVWIVDGWQERLSNDDYTITVRLIDPDIDALVREGLEGK